MQVVTKPIRASESAATAQFVVQLAKWKDTAAMNQTLKNGMATTLPFLVFVVPEELFIPLTMANRIQRNDLFGNKMFAPLASFFFRKNQAFTGVQFIPAGMNCKKALRSWVFSVLELLNFYLISDAESSQLRYQNTFATCRLNRDCARSIQGNAIEKFLVHEFSSNLAQRILKCSRFVFRHKKWGSPSSFCCYGDRNIMPPRVEKNIILRFGIMIFWEFH